MQLCCGAGAHALYAGTASLRLRSCSEVVVLTKKRVTPSCARQNYSGTQPLRKRQILHAALCTASKAGRCCV